MDEQDRHRESAGGRGVALSGAPRRAVQVAREPAIGRRRRFNAVRREFDAAQARGLVEPTARHAKEDEFIYLLEGEVVLVTDKGEETLRAGECAGFKAGSRDGHCLKNMSERDAVILTVGTRADADWGEYSDIDLKFLPGRYSGGGGYRRKDGSEIG